MKKINIKIVALCTLLITVVSCTSYVEDINVDPDNLIDSDAKNLFQGVLLANQFFQTSSNTRDVMIWLNQANGEDRQYVALNNWNNSAASSFDDSWNNAYVNTITQAKITSTKALAEGNPRLAGAMQVIEAHCIGTVTSLWGDVPYSEIDIEGKNLTPKFDSQAAVYTSIQDLLDKAILNLEKTTGPRIPDDKDIYYGGDTDKWLQLAYSLKARYYLHVKDYPKAKTNALLGINNADDDFKAQFGNSYGQNFNPFYSFLVYDRDSYMSGDSYAARLLDPSAALYRGNAKTNEAARFAFSYLGDDNAEYFSPYGLNIYGSDYAFSNGKFGSDSPIPMVTYGEMLLIIAEVDGRTSFNTGLASYNNYRALLNTGYSIGIDNSGYALYNYELDEEVVQSFKYEAYTALDFAVSGIVNPGTLTNQNALLKEIFQERYIYFMGTYETLNDFGRSNNLAGIQLKPDYAGTPQRLLYPQVEVNSNPNTPSPIPTIVTKTPVHN
jgi:hypothetical protein